MKYDSNVLRLGLGLAGTYATWSHVFSKTIRMKWQQEKNRRVPVLRARFWFGLAHALNLEPWLFAKPWG